MLKQIILVIVSFILLTACGRVSPTTVVSDQPFPTIELPTREPTDTPEPVEESGVEMSPAISPLELAGVYALPAGYLAERLIAPAVADVSAIAQSQTGRVYLQRGGRYGGISLLDVGSRDVTDILSTTGLEIGRVFNGPGDSVLVTDSWKGRMALYDASGALTRSFKAEGLKRPTGIALDSFGHVTVSDRETNRLLVWPLDAFR